MGRRAESLQDREVVVTRLRPHARALLLPLAVLLLALALGGFVAGRLPEGAAQQPGRYAVAAVTVLVVLRWAGAPWLRWLSTAYVVTDRRIGVERGVLQRDERSVPLSRIADVGLRRTLAQRLLGSGTLVLDTLGERRLVLRDVPDARQVACDIEDLLDGVPLDDPLGDSPDDA